LQVKDKTQGTITWEYVPNGSCKKDDFPNVAGPRGVPDVKRPQWEVRRIVNDFNENRLLNVVKSEILIPDEAMSPYQPGTTPSGDLPHLSYVEHKS